MIFVANIILPYNLCMNEKTLFEKIVDREIPATIIHEDEESLAFMDIHPVAKGHCLLITKAPYRWIQDVPDELLGRMFVKAKKIIEAMKAELACDFVQVAVEGKEVPHFHIKFIPRWNEDGLAGWPTISYGEDEMAEYAEKIKAGLK